MKMFFGAATLLVGLVASYAWADEGKELYETHCLNCHGPAGKGDGPAASLLKRPLGDLATALKGKSDTSIVRVIESGGRTFNQPAFMPAFVHRLTDEQIRSIVGYIKGFGK